MRVRKSNADAAESHGWRIGGRHSPRQIVTHAAVAVACVVAVVCGFAYTKRRSEIEVSRRWAERQKVEQALIQNSADVRRLADAVRSMHQTAEARAEEARAAVRRVLGREPGELPPPPPPPARKAVKVRPPPAEPAAPEEPAAATPKDQPEEADRPYGMPSREEFERQISTRKGQAPPEGAEGAEEAVKPPVPPPEPTPEITLPPPEPPIDRPAMTLLDCANTLSNRVLEIGLLVGEAVSSCEEFAQARTPGAVTLMTKTAEQRLDAAVRIEAAARADLARVEECAGRVRSLQTQFEREQAEQKRRADEARQAAEHQAQVEREMGILTQATAQARQLLKECQFSAAAEKLRGRAAELATAEGKAALAMAVQRYVRLEALKQFLVQRMNAEPFPWGWGPASNARDILGADDTVIKLKGATAAWAQVTPPQMKKFVTHYVGSRTLKRAEAGQHLLAAAIYFQEAGEPDLAAQYAAQATAADSKLAPEAQRLVQDQ